MSVTAIVEVSAEHGASTLMAEAGRPQVDHHVTVILASVIELIDTSIVNVALPT